ncbi:hypothetical protein E8E13_008531 [Curvularia kusanoi]|uniref:Uncharacterized protein n=1 Tax=Curvularia kusanoi TaxID=90978 RepID=A0A9P4WD02_CURKU|nr:hypothetical protein E8E13_008531 [Curvularia kusanoi]
MSLTPRRPELEDIELVESGLQKAKEHVDEKATVDLYHGTVTDGMSYLKNAKIEDLQRVLKTQIRDSTERSIKICLIKTPGDHTKWEKGNFSISPDIVRALRTAGLSDTLLSNVYSKTGYWAKMGNLQFSSSDVYGR